MALWELFSPRAVLSPHIPFRAGGGKRRRKECKGLWAGSPRELQAWQGRQDQNRRDWEPEAPLPSLPPSSLRLLAGPGCGPRKYKRTL